LVLFLKGFGTGYWKTNSGGIGLGKLLGKLNQLPIKNSGTIFTRKIGERLVQDGFLAIWAN